MINLTSNQKEIRKRIKASIDQEINMSDDYTDLIVLATILFDSAKTICTSYANDFGEEALENAIILSRKAK